MADVTIDVCSDDCDELIGVENAELSFIRISISSATIEMRWEQAETLFGKMRPFFEDEPAASIDEGDDDE